MSRSRWLTRALLALVLAATSFSVYAPISASTAAASPGCPGRSLHATNPGTFDKNHHPLVLVHGWTSSSDSMFPVEQALQKRMPNTFDFRYFDYRANSTDWAARPAIAACLADYVNEVSRNYRSAGGDGKVFLVGHSMGGLAIRFATDANTVGAPIPASVIGGIVTIDTPHEGSVFSNGPQAELVQWGKEQLGLKLAPDHTSDAARCLALHGPTKLLPPGCATPSYLPAGTHLAELSGTSTVRRTLFGIALYDIPLSSDGIVSVSSSHGYVASGPPGHKTPQTIGSLPSAECTITSDQTLALLAAAARGKSLPGAIISAEIKALTLLSTDNGILDAINNGQLSPDLEVLLGVALFFYPCGHSAMLRNADAMDATATSLRSYLSAVAPVSAADLAHAPVPSLCGHKPGTLVNGKLQGIPDNEGVVQLATVGGYRPTREMVALGDLNGDGIGDAAAVFTCNRGGVGWPDWVVFYGPGPKVIGAFDMSSVVGDARGGTKHISFTGGKITVETLDARQYDAGCCASGNATLTLRWTGQKVVAENVDHQVGAHDITFEGIGAVKLGMTARELAALGYTASQPMQGCLEYAQAGQPLALLDPTTGRVVSVTPNGSTESQTAIGGIKAGSSLLVFAQEAFAKYPMKKYFNQDFGQGLNGLVVTGPGGGSIGFMIEGTPTSDGLNTISNISVGLGLHATAFEVGCQ
jgi:pimeloyl-ACP methyl ester carboxylesterase